MFDFEYKDYEEIKSILDDTTFNELYNIYTNYGAPDDFEKELPEKIDGIDGYKIAEAIKFEYELHNYLDSGDDIPELALTCEEIIENIDSTGAKYGDFAVLNSEDECIVEAYLSFDYEMEDVQHIRYVVTDSKDVDKYNKLMRYLSIKELLE